ncbi:MAG: calcium/proton exchanger [Thermoanaerobaculia bacterium]|nr:calcium/proton exchanger [Thermoanaerobaculia bacterium]
MSWLLAFVPAVLALEFTHSRSHVAIFICSCLAILPLAGWLGKATEHLAERTSEGVGGLLNATFGNAAELIIALVALKEGYYGIVKASLTGSILGNLLLVLGASCLAGGLKHKDLKFNAAGARMMSTMLTLAAIALVMPASFHYLVHPMVSVERNLSLEIAIVLIVCYGLSLLFSLHTHKQLFIGTAAEAAEVEGNGHVKWSLAKSIGVLSGATAMIAWISEIMVGSIAEAAHSFGMTSVFVGVIVVAIIGNAAEHSTAILVARKNRMDLALGIAIGSSIQIALFVAPVLVFASYWLGPAPMDLVFTPAEVIAIVVAVAITSQIASDGESHWLEGVQLLAVYLILALIFFSLPEVLDSTGALPAPTPQ